MLIFSFRIKEGSLFYVPYMLGTGVWGMTVIVSLGEWRWGLRSDVKMEEVFEVDIDLDGRYDQRPSDEEIGRRFINLGILPGNWR